MKRVGIICLILILTITQSCRKELNVPTEIKQINSVLFSTRISGENITRVSGNVWDTEDSLSIYMYESDQFSINSILPQAFNKKFIASRAGNLRPADLNESFQFPEDKEVRFLAFHPFQRGRLVTRLLDIEDQQDQSALDFLHGQSDSAHVFQQSPISLVFERIMVKLQITLSNTESSGFKATLKQVPTKATYHLRTKELSLYHVLKDIEGYVSKNSKQQTTVEWMLFPEQLPRTSQLVVQDAKGGTYTWNIGEMNLRLLAGNRYQYELSLRGGEVLPEVKTSYLEVPRIESSANLEYKFRMTPDGSKRNFSMLYDKTNRLAHWVAYPLSRDYIGSQRRTNAWSYDPLFPQNTQPFLSSGFGIPGVDRGHQLPSADRTKNFAENATTFYYTNMTAQESFLNQGLWMHLEEKIRNWTFQAAVDTMYVVTGAVVQTKEDQTIDYVMDRGQNRIARPKYYYKALAVKRGDNYYSIGFKMDNKYFPTDNNFMSHRLSVADLEELTGLTFFPGLDPSIKRTIDNQIWR